MNSPRNNASAPTSTRERVIAVAILAALACVLEPKNPSDPTGQTGFQLRGGTSALLDRESAKPRQSRPVESNFGQDAGY